VGDDPGEQCSGADADGVYQDIFPLHGAMKDEMLTDFQDEAEENAGGEGGGARPQRSGGLDGEEAGHGEDGEVAPVMKPAVGVENQLVGGWQKRDEGDREQQEEGEGKGEFAAS
jgi:hypothetical protein